MEKRFGNITNTAGDAISGATVTVTTYPAGSTALIYPTDEVGTPITNGTLTTDSKGYYQYYAPNGSYTETYSGTGIQTYSISDISISDDSASLAALAASSGSSLVGFIQSGTGAVATTVQGKSRQIVSVKDFGAVGDAVTDDAAAIRLAVAYLQTIGGGVLWFPVGKYIIGSSITTSGSVYGVIFQGQGNRDAGAFSGTTIVQNFTGVLFDTSNWNTEFNHLTILQGGSGAGNTVFKFSPNSGYSQDIRVRDCHIVGGETMISASAAINFEISGTKFICTSDTTKCIYIFQPAAGNNPVGCYIKENYFNTFTSYNADCTAVYLDCVDTVHVFENIMQGPKYGVRIAKSQSYTNNLIHIYNNNIEACTANCIIATTVNNLWIDENELVGDATNTVRCVDISTALGSVFIRGNLVTKAKQECIYANGSGPLVISGNKINDASQQTNTTYSSIRLNGCTWGAITGNYFGSNDIGSNTPLSYVNLDGSTTYFTVAGNFYKTGTTVLSVLSGSTNNRIFDSARDNSGASIVLPLTFDTLYEYGTWTPVVKFGGTSITNTPSNCVYTRCGNTFHFRGSMTFNRGTTTGNMTFSGFKKTGVAEKFPTGQYQLTPSEGMTYPAGYTSSLIFDGDATGVCYWIGPSGVLNASDTNIVASTVLTLRFDFSVTY